ncbi:CheB methylesterase domain-containing protein [Alicyclobacillus fastidiosus]|uniref:protein-glutamate methylesterase n=1 Tax=Alicyclobacillus fastidiosus TaxID=392011 RepID=A0ABV5AGR1_9BACL|nr:CheB methylesterase domain-containing protein [Alicyclobacillus fastidiosus]WEH07910.1 CheB methylesterase domain-containing protein [Alicyclobacillus fastidiosus]
MDIVPDAGPSRLRALVVIGTSTGGPKALTELFSALPAVDGVACCVVQHMPAGFTANLAKRLNENSEWAVAEGRDGEFVQAGHAYIAPGGMHMRVQSPSQGLSLSIRREEPVGGHQPSVDVLFHSTTDLAHRLRLVGVLLTGMGKDGADGLWQLRQSGALTIAESRETAVIYGMPRAAVERGAAMEIAPLSSIPNLLLANLQRA